jgi:hypothetical protein
MYDTISKNMLNMFAAASEINNFVGEPILAYKSQHSKLKFFRKVFFNKLQNQPDLDKYVGIYKWIDDALDSILFNLLPASANASEKVRTIVENHILERNKVAYPLLPDKSVKVDDGSGIVEFKTKFPVYFIDSLTAAYKDNTGYIPPEGEFAEDFFQNKPLMGQNKNNPFAKKKHFATKAAGIKK